LEGNTKNKIKEGKEEAVEIAEIMSLNYGEVSLIPQPKEVCSKWSPFAYGRACSAEELTEVRSAFAYPSEEKMPSDVFRSSNAGKNLVPVVITRLNFYVGSETQKHIALTTMTTSQMPNA
jgi:hypothetical protein